MYRDPSARSVAQSSISEVPSIFSKQLPQEAVDIIVNLPRGLKCAASPRLAGGVKGPAGVMTFPTKRYELTMSPNARPVNAKEQLRMQARAFATMETNFWESKPEALTEWDRKHMFRQERLVAFQAGLHFPALVSPRLVPSWESAVKHCSVADPASETEAAEAGSQQRDLLSARGASLKKPLPEVSPSPRGQVTKPTVAQMRKCRPKHAEVQEESWHITGTASASHLVCDRKPVMFEDIYSPQLPPHLQTENVEESKKLWMAPVTLLPPSPAIAKYICASGRMELHNDIAAIREKGRVMNQALKERHDVHRRKWESDREQVMQLSLMERARWEAAQEKARTDKQPVPVVRDARDFYKDD